MRGMHTLRCAKFFVLSAFVIFTIVSCGGGGEGEETKTTKIADLKGANWQSYIGQQVTIEGYFVKDPVPMIVTDINVMLENSVMLDDKYIILTGDQAAQISAEENGGAKMYLDGVVAAADAKVYPTEKITIASSGYTIIDKKIVYKPVGIPFEIIEALKDHRYAILFSGGYNSSNNHVRYWNDLKFMYSTLVNKYGFAKSKITVLYGSGTGRDDEMPVTYSATQTNLETAVDYLKEVSSEEDLIFVFFTNHGGGFKEGSTDPNNHGGRLDSSGDEGTEPIFESTYGINFNGDGDMSDQVAWDEEILAWGGHIYDDAFISMFDDSLNYSNLIIVMEQCYSAGPILDMSVGGENRIIMSAAGQYESSYAMPPDYSFDEFSYYFTSAINGTKPDGTVVDADLNNDSKVSMVEAFNYARSNDSRPETPNYEDSGDGIAHTGSMPSGGDGTFGSNISLDE